MTPTDISWPRLLLNEVLYDPSEGGNSGEWVEIYNASPDAVTLSGWKLGDFSSSKDTIPAFTLAPYGYLVIAAKEIDFRANHPGFAGDIVDLNGTIGNGLSNTGDVVRLLAPGDRDTLIDAMSYGGNDSTFKPPCPHVSTGQSLARIRPVPDSDTAVDWVPQPIPNPARPTTPPASRRMSTKT